MTWLNSLRALGSLSLLALSVPALAQQAPLQIGASLSLSGALAQSGEMMKRGYGLWEKDVNARGGLLGRQVKLVLYDDQSDSGTSARLYEKLITEDKVDLLLGPYGSAAAFAASAVTEKHKFPILLPAAASDAIFARGFKYAFQLQARVSGVFDSLLGEIASKNKLTTVAILHSPDIYPKAVGNAAAAHAEKYGRKVVLREEFPLNSKDLSSVVLKLRAAKPDIIVVGAQLPDSILLMRQLREAQYQPKAIAITPGAVKDDFGQSLGKDAEGVMGDYLWEPVSITPESKAFSEMWRQAYKQEPDYHSAISWIAGQILEAAVKRAGSLEADKIRAAYLATEMKTMLPGVFKLDPETGGQLGLQLGLVQWKNGRREIVDPTDLATSPLVIPLPQ